MSSTISTLNLKEIKLRPELSLWSLAHLTVLSTHTFSAAPVIDHLLYVVLLLNFFLGNKALNLLCCLLAIGSGLYHFPEIANHEVILLIADAIVLKSLLNEDKEVSYEPKVMGAVYIVAGLAKLNQDFFNSEFSCLKHFITWNPWFPVAIASGEIAIGIILLLFKGPLTLIPALAFHGYLLFFGFFDFFIVSLALLVPKTWLSFQGRSQLAYYLPFLMSLLIPKPQYYQYQPLLVLLFIAPFLVLTWPGIREELQLPGFRFNSSGVPLSAVIVFVIGSFPYMGIADYPTFSMFSNLQVSSVYTNSFLVSRPLLTDPNWMRLPPSGTGPISKEWKLRRVQQIANGLNQDVYIPEKLLFQLEPEVKEALVAVRSDDETSNSFYFARKPFTRKACQW